MADKKTLHSSEFPRELGRSLTFLHRNRTKFMSEKLKSLGFSGAMYMILLHVDRFPATSQDNIATHMYIDKCNVTRRTNKLEELGYIRRETDENDRRQKNLYLTEKGKEIAPKIRKYLREWGESITENFTDDEKDMLLFLLEKMRV